MTEPEVIQKTHRFLHRHRLWDRRVVRLYTDAHATLLPHTTLRPFQRFTLDVGDFVVYPDLVGQLDDGETIFAVEGKGSSDLLKGLARAELYQVGFHQSFLAADAATLGDTLLRLARLKNVGVLAVGDEVHLAHLPEVRLPWREPFRAIVRQMETVVQVSGQQTFRYNLPTHYLAWTLLLQPRKWYAHDEIERALDPYPMPSDWLSALRGAQKLKLTQAHGQRARLTPVGEAVREILATSPEEWGEVHEKIKSRSRAAPTLAEYRPAAAAILRILVLQDPMVRLVIDGLRTFSDHQANFADLARACDQLDHARAPIFFFNPETIEQITNEKGKLLWEQLQGHHYRSTMFYQYKSILKHAGVIKNLRLGGSTAKTYDPTQDIWALR